MNPIPQQLIGKSARFHALLDWVSDIASLDLPILILGETGTDKELIASRLHFLSPRWEQSFHVLNCAAHTDNELKKYIFGTNTQTALIDLTQDGTLFLNNIETLSDPLLERLSNMVENNEYISPDTFEKHDINIRLITSTNPAILANSERRQTLSGFLDRLSTDVVNIPPLRDRTEDILPLAMHYGRKIAVKLGADKFPGLSPEALEELTAYEWPGNMRELCHVIERSTAHAYLTDESLTNPLSVIIFNPFIKTFQSRPEHNNSLKTSTITEASKPNPLMPLDETHHNQSTHFNERILKFERGLIDEAMKISHHHQGKASQYLGLTYHAFRGLLRKHGLKK